MNAPATEQAAKLDARRHQGTACKFWLDGAGKQRLTRLRHMFAETMGVQPSTSVILRAALKALEDRASCVASLGPDGEALGFLAIRRDLAEAADGRDRA